jgi:probable phosphoglycerate mutase
VQTRVIGALEKMAEAHPRGEVAVVAHAGTVKMALAHFLGVPLDLYQRLNAAPASLSAVWLGRMGPRIMLVNDISHYAPDDADFTVHNAGALSSLR